MTDMKQGFAPCTCGGDTSLLRWRCGAGSPLRLENCLCTKIMQGHVPQASLEWISVVVVVERVDDVPRVADIDRPPIVVEFVQTRYAIIYKV